MRRGRSNVAIGPLGRMILRYQLRKEAVNERNTPLLRCFNKTVNLEPERLFVGSKVWSLFILTEKSVPAN